VTFPADIRVNAAFPFPSLVEGAAPITIGKASGIWTIGYSIVAFAPGVPPPTSDPTDFVLVYDSVAQVYFKMSIEAIVSAAQSSVLAGARAQRFTTTTPVTVTSTDQIITTGITSAATCVLPLASTRLGVPLTFKDLGQATAHNIVFTTSGSDTIDGLSRYVMNRNYAEATFVPFLDGINTGWFIS
jgi:hypothetical protein